MSRFTLRGLRKVSIQRLYYCLVHNAEKIATTGAINNFGDNMKVVRKALAKGNICSR